MWSSITRSSKSLAYLAVAFVAGACASQLQVVSAQPLEAGQASVLPTAKARQALSPNGKARIHHLARGHQAYLGLLELEAGAAVPEHQDPTEEFIHVLEGGGQMVLNGQTYEVSAGDTIYMPAGASVSFTNGDAKMRALQVFAGPAPADKYENWQAQGGD